MSNQESNASLKNDIEELKRELAAVKREKGIIEQQLKLKDRHLEIILKNATIALSAFNRNGEVELIKGKGVDIESEVANAAQIIGQLHQSSPETLKKFMPNVMEAVQVAFEQKVRTYSETKAPQGLVYYTIYVPFLNEKEEVEYVYSIAIRLPNEGEIDNQYFFKGELNMDEISLIQKNT